MSRYVAILTILLITQAVHAADWPAWRGPTGIGATDEKDLPLKWDGKTKEGLLWVASLKGMTGHSSPIVYGDKVIITTAMKQTNKEEADKIIPDHHIRCFNVADGKELWSTKIEPGKQPAGYAIYAVPTPCTDGQAIYAWWGSGVIVAVDMDGKLLWRHERDGPYVLNPGLTTSPILYQDTVILLCDQGKDLGWLQGLDKKTGEIKWQVKRTKTNYNNTTPILMPVNEKPQLIILGERAMQGLDPVDGHTIWSCKARGFGPSPVYGSGLVFGIFESAVAVDPTGQGDVTATHLKWKIDKTANDYGSPVISGEYIYRAHKPGIIKCWKLATGEEVYSETADKAPFLSSPVATADARIYFVGAAKSYVIKAGPKFEILATNDLKGSDNGSSPAVANGRIFVRDAEHLYCIGNK